MAINARLVTIDSKAYMQIENILESEIFFFVTTIAVVVVAFTGVIAGIYIIKILRDLRFIIKDIKYKYGFIQKILNYIIK